jgi:tripartite-type tricarboxylate transporter receptor subunit TctC
LRRDHNSGAVQGEEFMKVLSASRWLLAATLAFSAAEAAQAQSYPNRQIRMILPFAAGGAGDTFARPLAQSLSQSLGQPVVIENIVGAAAIIGTQVAARAPADGYTLLMVSNALAIGETMSPKRGYLLMREFTPITQLNALSLVLVTNPKLPVKSVAELIALAKSQPGKLNYASSGVGSIYHLPMEHLKSMAGIDIQHVPYKSSSQARMDVIAGEPSMMMDALATMQGQIKEGQVRAIGVASLKRTDTAPDIPAIAETVPGYSGDAWLGFMAPAGTPPEIVNKLQVEIAKVLATPEVKAAYRAQDAVPVASTPAAFSTFLKDEIDKWGKAIHSAGVPIQE